MRAALRALRVRGRFRLRARHRHRPRCADVLLPAAGWGEKDGTVTNSERRISRQRAFLPSPGEARPDWWIVSRGGARAWASPRRSPTRAPAEIFREHAALSGFENDGTPRFRHQWPGDARPTPPTTLCCPCSGRSRRRAPHGTERLFGDGRFATADRRARFVACGRARRWPAPVPTTRWCSIPAACATSGTP